jgi:hypothetical protein
MSQESPEQQMPLALSPTALAQRDANTMPTEYPKSIGKKTLDARYARDARRLPETTHWISARDDEGLSRLSLDADAAAHKLTFPRRALRRVPRRFRSPTDSNMSPASKFVNAKKGGKKSSHGCVRARANHPRPSDARRRLAFREGRKKKLTPLRFPSVSVSTRRCMPSQLEGNFRRAAAPSGPGASRFAAPPSRFGAQR